MRTALVILSISAVGFGSPGCSSSSDKEPSGGRADPAETMAHDDAVRAERELEKERGSSSPAPRPDYGRGSSTVDQPRGGRP
ncbi:MAG: hypothetical protein HRU75_13710 [Planctomycetia bacterium]|nr:MAG: hypothetical protein HRU75_13710 [Planctomycetia bacterium]